MKKVCNVMPGNRIREARELKGISQLKLAIMTNIVPGDISKLENRLLYPHPGWRKRLSAALEMPESELFPEC